MFSRVAFAVVMLAACEGKSPPRAHASLTAAQERILTVRVGRHAAQVHLRVPANYMFQAINGQQVGHLQTDWNEPEIELTSESVDYQDHPRSSPMRDENCRPIHTKEGEVRDPSFWTISKHETRPEGFMNVCTHATDGHIVRTDVVRNWLWEGHPFQCEVRFGKLEIDPSDQRVKDAIAICDTVEPREIPVGE